MANILISLFLCARRKRRRSYEQFFSTYALAMKLLLFVIASRARVSGTQRTRVRARLRVHVHGGKERVYSGAKRARREREKRGRVSRSTSPMTCSTQCRRKKDITPELLDPFVAKQLKLLAPLLYDYSLVPAFTFLSFLSSFPFLFFFLWSATYLSPHLIPRSHDRSDSGYASYCTRQGEWGLMWKAVSEYKTDKDRNEETTSVLRW